MISPALDMAAAPLGRARPAEPYRAVRWVWESASLRDQACPALRTGAELPVSRARPPRWDCGALGGRQPPKRSMLEQGLVQGNFPDDVDG